MIWRRESLFWKCFILWQHIFEDWNEYLSWLVGEFFVQLLFSSKLFVGLWSSWRVNREACISCSCRIFVSFHVEFGRWQLKHVRWIYEQLCWKKKQKKWFKRAPWQVIVECNMKAKQTIRLKIGFNCRSDGNSYQKSSSGLIAFARFQWNDETMK